MPIRTTLNKRFTSVSRKVYKNVENIFMLGLNLTTKTITRQEVKINVNAQRKRNNEIFRKMKTK